MKRFFCSITAIALIAGMACAQDLSKKITFECPAETVDQVFAKLAKLTGINFTSEPATASDVLLISVKDQSVGKLLQEIATACSAQWMTIADEYRLIPDPEKRQKEQADWVARRADAIVKTLAKNSPGNGGLSTIIAALDPTALAQLESGQRIVYSNQPNNAQVASSLLNADNLASLLNGRVPENNSGELPKTVLAVSNSQDTYRFRLDVYNRKGGVIASETGGLAGMAALIAPSAFTLPDALTSADTAAVAIPDTTTELIKNGMDRGTPHTEKLSKEALDILGHPYAHDPLSLYAGPALLQRAKECDLPIVADLPDSVSLLQSATAADFLKDAAQKGLLQAKISKECLIVMPGDPASSRRHRANRKALETLMQAGLTKQSARLTDLAAFAIAEPRPPEAAAGNDASVPYLKAILPNLQNFSEQNSAFGTLRFFGFLSPDQQQTALKEQQVSLTDLSANAQTALNELVFGADAIIEKKGAPQAANPRYGYRRVGAPLSRGFTVGMTYETEPTESMLNGYGPQANFCVLASQGRMGGIQPEIIFTFTFQLLKDVDLVSTLNESLPKQ
ncbi:MAG TPA: hypothetical protein VGL56_19630 [Fimbriimonadaceae bacterium]